MYDDAKPLVSVIIPVWNPGPCISRCIESLRNQTLSDIEMIFIDDCGTDDSMEKVRTAASEDPRIRIIENEENIGAGPSRNKGIRAACGDYLSFVDPDDYLASDFLSLLYLEVSKGAFDIIKGSLVRVRENGTILADDRKQNQVISNKLSAGKPLYNSFTYAHQTAIYRRDYIIARNAFYGTSARGQDTTFLLKACSQTESFSLVDEAWYYFCGRSDSAMHSIDEIKLQGFLQSCKEQIQYIASALPDDPDTRAYIKNTFYSGIREYARYDHVKGLEESAGRYIEALREELMGLSFCEDLIKDSFSLRALRDYGAGLPMSPYFSPWEGINPPIRYAQLVKRWVDFYMEHPEERRSINKSLILIYNKAKLATLGKPATTYSLRERTEGKKLLNKQMGRLPLHMQAQVITVSALINHAKAVRRCVLKRQR